MTVSAPRKLTFPRLSSFNMDTYFSYLTLVMILENNFYDISKFYCCRNEISNCRKMLRLGAESNFK